MLTGLAGDLSRREIQTKNKKIVLNLFSSCFSVGAVHEHWNRVGTHLGARGCGGWRLTWGVFFSYSTLFSQVGFLDGARIQLNPQCTA